MKIFNSLDTIENMPKTAVALGNFDGVHKGHMELIKTAVTKASRSTSQGIPMRPCVFTFSNNPRNLIPGKKEVKNIIYQDEKEKLIQETGIEYLVNVPFTEEIMTMSPERYVREILVEKLNAGEVICGFNHRFGFRAEGNTKLLKELGQKYGWKVFLPPFKFTTDNAAMIGIVGQYKYQDQDFCPFDAPAFARVTDKF